MGLKCQKCGRATGKRTNRYCSDCGKEVRRRMGKSGYLQDTYVPRYFSDERGRKGMRDPRVLAGVPH